MCDTCNCNREESFAIHNGRPAAQAQGHPGHSDEHTHSHDGVHFHSHGSDHPHSHDHSHPRVVSVNESIFGRNDRQAERNRGFFEARGVFVLNLISSPGAGKTTLLEKTLESLGSRLRMAVIVGDLATENDATRLRGKGAEVIQVTTGTLCHLDAEMVHRAVQSLDLNGIDILFIENVGNLVCPASFDLGEAARVALLSVTEGEDKPLKYPPVFKSADAVLLTKSDLTAASGFDRDTGLANIGSIAPQARLFELSAQKEENLAPWFEWLEHCRGHGPAVASSRLPKQPDAASNLP